MSSPAPRKDRSAFYRQLVLAIELPFVLVGGVVIGGGIGWLLDRWLNSAPWMVLLFGLLGFGGGMREVLRRLSASGNSNGSSGNKNEES